MSQTIQINPDELRAQASQLRGYAEQHDEIIQRLTNLVASLDEVWKGEAQSAFVKRFQESRDIFNSFDEALASFSEIMDTSADKMENTDLSLKRRINSIS